ncbi:MAG TPA: hypothetical protein VNA89_03820 [Gemmatimonadaceae bacterium]|nr:hypothetical protein [Gemmatimonadaceae bacterium]
MKHPSGQPVESVTPRSAAVGDRRNNVVLRSLIDDMLERVREMNRNNGVWTGDERARAEAELEGIMARVRRVAASRHNNGGGEQLD